ncbi:MAG TPA: hypothetical protein V6D23_01635 [Candidatus Obscuribacterales bacterium]
MDIAVTQDGKTVYAINTDCSAYLGEPTDPFNSVGCAPSSRYRYDVFKRRSIFRLRQNAPAEVILQKDEPSLSCKLPRDLEIDQQDNLYLINALDSRIERISPILQQETFLEIREDTDIYDRTGRPTPPLSYPPPAGLQIRSNDLYFELFKTIGEAEFVVRKVDIQTSQNQEELFGSHAYGLSGNYYYGFVDNKIYGVALSELPNDYIYPDRLGSFSFLQEVFSFQPNPQAAYPPPLIDLERQPDITIKPHELRTDSKGRIYLSDMKNHLIWTISLSGDKTTANMRVLAGSGQAGFKDGKGGDASFDTPGALSFDGAGNLYVADTGNSAIRKVTPDGTVTTFYKAPDS